MLGRKGFTLIELLITIFLVSVGLIGALSFFNANVQSNIEAKNEVIAAGLAQEGSELVRNLIEYKRLEEGETWDDISFDLVDKCATIDHKSLTGSRTCQDADWKDVCFVEGRYEQCSSDGIGMSRTIEIQCVDVNETVDNSCSADKYGLKISTTVEWNNHERKTTAKDIIYENRY